MSVMMLCCCLLVLMVVSRGEPAATTTTVKPKPTPAPLTETQKEILRIQKGKAPTCTKRGRPCGPGSLLPCPAPCLCSNNGEARKRGRCNTYGTFWF
ncbi:hypothetical protein BV898_17543 [Hypsibius exemplaris]|uniref:Uncharacterized protein n=1 Tax=Hypsibius exemplaris TaxID=2072580 RepID=A0A9X6NFT3_HYPEX|nr:hypothetical protein BV898_17543 [Hypsibius exemplaris]